MGNNFHDSTNVMGGGVILKQHALTDLSRPEQDKRTNFDEYINQFKRFKNSSRVEGVLVNTGYNTKNKPVRVVGRLKMIKIDRTNKTVRAFIYDPTNNKELEVYADTLIQVNESYIKSLEEFLIQD